PGDVVVFGGADLAKTGGEVPAPSSEFRYVVEAAPIPAAVARPVDAATLPSASTSAQAQLLQTQSEGQQLALNSTPPPPSHTQVQMHAMSISSHPPMPAQQLVVEAPIVSVATSAQVASQTLDQDLIQPHPGAAPPPQQRKERRVTAYGLFSKKVRPALKNEYRKQPAAEITKVLKRRFKELPAAERKEYDELATQHNAALDDPNQTSPSTTQQPSTLTDPDLLPYWGDQVAVWSSQLFAPTGTGYCWEDFQDPGRDI
ncbi:hypothetical protein HK104_007199, partial [Borealophlyctis nickersoniae]